MGLCRCSLMKTGWWFGVVCRGRGHAHAKPPRRCPSLRDHAGALASKRLQLLVARWCGKRTNHRHVGRAFRLEDEVDRLTRAQSFWVGLGIAHVDRFDGADVLLGASLQIKAFFDRLFECHHLWCRLAQKAASHADQRHYEAAVKRLRTHGAAFAELADWIGRCAHADRIHSAAEGNGPPSAVKALFKDSA